MLTLPRRLNFDHDAYRCHGHTLTGRHRHWCPDWDYMPIDETCPEIEACTCVFEVKRKSWWRTQLVQVAFWLYVALIFILLAWWLG